MKVCLVIQPYGLEDMDHTPNSPDLTPCNFQLSGRLKKNLTGKRFKTDADVIQAVTSRLQTTDTYFLNAQTKTLGSRCDSYRNFRFDNAEVLYLCSATLVLCARRSQITFSSIILFVALLF
jgi:hypothetical protein